MDTEDQREDELSTISAIYPEIQRLHPDDPYTFTIDLPVNPPKVVTVVFLAAATGHALNTTVPQTIATAAMNEHTDSHEIAHLPAIRLQISLPPSYPTEHPPAVSVSTTPSWLPSTVVKTLEDECARLWEDLGRDLVVFSYIDHVMQSADAVFGLLTETGALQLLPEHKIAVLDYDIEAKRRVFNNETFFCGVCLDPRKGAKCHRMLDCGHVFCRQCLQDFYNNAINEGDLASIRCLEPGCAKKREASQTSGEKKHRKGNTEISPSELLQIGHDQDMVKRYVALKYKTWLESDKNVIYCPRGMCQGPARTKKHKKPKGLELHEAAEDSGPDEETSAGQAGLLEDRLAVCDDCGFAFCSRCNRSWHGAYVYCTDHRDTAELSAEEKASLEFIRLHTSPCPTCDCAAQKTEGCNHMICYKCETHFCYLCSAWLDPANPYQHFNEMPNGRRTTCYMRLWEMEEGDQGGENHFEGPRGEAIQQRQARRLPEGQGRILFFENQGRQARPVRERVALDREVAVTQEGPLVLRLGVVAPRVNDDPPALAPQPQPQPARGQRANDGEAREGAGEGDYQPQAQQVQRAREGQPRAFGWRQNQAQRRRRAPIERADINWQVDDAVGAHDQVGGDDAAWIRHFVELALVDREEDLLVFEDE